MVRILVFSLVVFSVCSSQWAKQTFPTTETLWKVRLATSQIGWIVGTSHIYKTTNGGSNWLVQDTSFGGCDAICVLDEQTMMYQNWSGLTARGIRRTSDGGATWQTVDTIQQYYADMSFPNKTIGFASGSDENKKPVVMKSTDGGIHWFVASKDFLKAKAELTGISFTDTSNGWAISYDGFVYHSTDGGLTWSYQDSLALESFRDVEFANNDTGYAVGGIGGEKVIATTYDGGKSWTKTKSQGGSLREVQILSSGNIWSVGWPGNIIVKRPGENSWQTQMNNYSLNFESISMINDTFGLIVGGLGTLYKTTNGGVTYIQASDIAPSQFSLEQNYPNPFNPTTTVQYQLSKDSYVNLKVYNLLGQEVATLFEGSQKAGYHSAQWDAQNIVSGMYMYRMTTENFVQTRKMILVK